MIFAEYASPTPGRAFNSAAEAVLMSTRSPCEGAGEVALGVAALEGAVALGLAGASFPVGEVDWANTGKAIFRARIVAPRCDYVHRFSPFVLGQTPGGADNPQPGLIEGRRQSSATASPPHSAPNAEAAKS